MSKMENLDTEPVVKQGMLRIQNIICSTCLVMLRSDLKLFGTYDFWQALEN